MEYVESIKEHFRKRWSFEYVTSLRECLKSFKPERLVFSDKKRYDIIIRRETAYTKMAAM